ncbi:PREDICTED: uncharacterized protein LOC109206220 [Nicotiana attenuata]|uniref:uncharacterized protein LOC109206220 n=1 Tax=Nicotiana attenuata TaxID=49451 RepID=UPI00090525E5|nr:PREDICTED: uncharacterized protein LOC109206220 [Nicotiana attenuata]
MAMDSPKQACWIVKKVFDTRQWFLEKHSRNELKQYQRNAHRKLATVDRLRRWGNIVDTECVLCDTNEEESMEHIWFGCRYAKTIWYTLVNWLHEKHQIGTWDDEIKWLTSRNPSRTCGEIRVFLFTAMVYHVWIERNSRRFQGKAVEARQKIKDIALELHLAGQNERKWQKELARLKNYPSIV